MDWLKYTFGLLLIFFTGLILGRMTPAEGQTEPLRERVDTLVICDTITATEPVFYERRVIDSVLVPVTDSVMVHDTIFVVLEREQVVWQDSLSVVYASGINPQVDSVTHFTSYKVITIERDVPVKVQSRWGVGVQAGFGASKDGLTPFVGVGLSYNILSW